MGTNGVVRDRQLERLARLAAGVPRVIAVTVHVDRPWAEPSNAALHAAARRYPWLRLADWHAVAREHPEWFGRDGVHPTRTGARHYAALVAATATG
jgi:lysophospholipase L1-like esterase